MAYPPPPGLKNSQSGSKSSTPQPHPSLPARPPPPANSPSSFAPSFPNSGTSAAAGTKKHGNNGGSFNSGSFTGFKPRTVNNAYPSPSASSSAPSPGYSASQTAYPGAGYQESQYHQSYYPQQDYTQPTPPQMVNPFPLPGQESSSGAGRGRGFGGSGTYDPDYEAQIAQWQSAYATKDDASASKGAGRGRTDGSVSVGNANRVPLGSGNPSSAQLSTNEVNAAVNSDTGVASVVAGADGRQKTVVRSGGGRTWQDPTLLEWDPAHFRFFVGNLAGEVTDDSLLKAFSKYPSLVKAKVVRDKRTTKSEGYGFVSFSDGDDFFRAAKEMQGKYIGSHPVLIRRSTTEIKAVNPNSKKNNGKGGRRGKDHKRGGGSGGNGVSAAGVSKQTKTKGGLKILG
ncbi:RNA-binding domain-containing protein [Viridothelium virens]|uniref:RNA-binding domain-containing protein n=1 Tax=Viridothelium virens TaxID=1048519 RepID=A0A6A6H872_VIRVR|nr:RNA-binding domain-containing protein [Viridothelium virens]